MNNRKSGAKRFVVDLAGLATKGDLHGRIRRAMELPEYYGENLDALYDLLTEMDEGTEIVFTGADAADGSLGGYLDILREMCGDAENENPGLTILFR